jgi:DNA-binding response OmpR family regulator
MGEASVTPSVLVVDDEEEVADVYALHLEAWYDVAVAYGGEAALDAVDETTDVVLLDRRMPDLSGDEVLARIREQELGCVVVMVTAVDPELNILEMEFDDYLSKPLDGDTLREAIEQHVGRETADPRVAEFFQVLSKLEVLEDSTTGADPEDDPEFKRLKRRAVELREALVEEVEEFDDLVAAFEDVSRT